jgi:hypothetical protein
MALAEQVPVENRTNLPARDFDSIARMVACHRSIKHALDWMLSQRPPLELSDMVTQDEFSHDFLVAYMGGLWLSYDST